MIGFIALTVELLQSIIAETALVDAFEALSITGITSEKILRMMLKRRRIFLPLLGGY